MRIYQHRNQRQSDEDDCRKRERQKSLQCWQAQWDSSVKGRWTHQLVPWIAEWLNRKHGDPSYYLTQMKTRKRCFREYLYKYKHEDSPTCHRLEEDARHVFFTCPRFNTQRRKLESKLVTAITPENLVRQMLASEKAWSAATDFARKVIEERRKEEKRTANDRCGAPGYGVGFLPQSSSPMQRNAGSRGETIHRITRYSHTCAHSPRRVDGLNSP